MKRLLLILAFITINLSAYAGTQNYILVDGGGTDDLSLMLKNIQGKTIHAYCNQKCGKWFDPDEEIDGQTLKKQYINKKFRQRSNLKKMQDGWQVLVMMNYFTLSNTLNYSNNRPPYFAMI